MRGSVKRVPVSMEGVCWLFFDVGAAKDKDKNGFEMAFEEPSSLLREKLLGSQ